MRGLLLLAAVALVAGCGDDGTEGGTGGDVGTGDALGPTGDAPADAPADAGLPDAPGPRPGDVQTQDPGGDPGGPGDGAGGDPGPGADTPAPGPGDAASPDAGGLEDLGPDDAGGAPDAGDVGGAEDAAGPGDAEAPDGAAPGDAAPPDAVPDGDPADAGPPPVLTAAACFAGQLGDLPGPPVDYDQYQPVIGSHCKGTNHQDIGGVERVVFAGDSITVGTPPTPAGDWYRNVLADALADRFGLTKPGLLWQNVDLINGVTLAQSSGDFWSCAKFGARTDDLTRPPHKQLETCNPVAERDKTTLVVFTAGGNDVFAWAQDLVEGATLDALWDAAELAIQDLEASVHWLVDDPSMFPNGVFVVFANPFEFTDPDSGNDFAKCPGANLISMDWALIDPAFDEITAWFMGEYMRIATDTGTDLVFLGEHTCGHGHMKDDPAGRCYRGPGTDLWLDVTCMHPSSAGHAGIADLFLAVIDE